MAPTLESTPHPERDGDEEAAAALARDPAVVRFWPIEVDGARLWYVELQPGYTLEDVRRNDVVTDERQYEASHRIALLWATRAQAPAPAGCSPKAWLTVREAARELSVSERLLRRLLAEGSLAGAAVRAGRTWRLNRERLAEELAHHPEGTHGLARQEKAQEPREQRHGAVLVDLQPRGRREGPLQGDRVLPGEDARRALKIFEGKVAAGEDPMSMPTGNGSSPAPRVPTLADYLDETYLPVIDRDKSAGTARGARTAAKALKHRLGAMSLSEVAFRQVDAYVTARRAEGRRSRTVAIELWVLRGCLQHAADCALIAEVPKLPSVSINDRPVAKYLTPEQSSLVLDALRPVAVQPHRVTRGAPPVCRDRLTYLAVLMALNLEMRKGEILSRGWQDVLWSLGPHGTLLVRAAPAIGFEVKTRRERAVPLTPELRIELDALRAEAGVPTSGWIFPAPDAPTKPRKDFKGALARACRRAGVPVVHPHALRHTWATRLAMAGVDRRSLMDLGGWTSSSVLDEVYAHATESHKAEVMTRMGLGPTPRGVGG